jgi:cell division protease FtsH
MKSEKKGGFEKLIKGNWLILVLILIIGASFAYSEEIKKADQNIAPVNISQVVEEVKADKVDHILVDGNKLNVFLKDPSSPEASKDKEEQIAYKEEGVSLADYGIAPDKVKVEVKNNDTGSIWIDILPTAILFLLMGGFIWMMMKSAQSANNQAMSFGKSRARVNLQDSRVTFKDVAGSEEAKKDLVEIVDFLKNPKKYKDLGAEIPKGVLLMGPPGTGKTLLAKAVSGEAGVPFFSISGSEFVEMFVGVGASRVRDLFAKAKRNAPCIIFIDEIDAVGRQRGAGLGGSHDEREQTLNQILVELDGFDTDSGVIVIAATNRADVLDPALLRPGRFDRRVLIDLPDIRDREAILKVHIKSKPLEGNVDLFKIAQKTPGFSGADLRNLLNEAAILSARDNKTTISGAYLNEAIEKTMMGPQRTGRVITAQERKITAYHEAGHALVAHFLPNADPVQKISIISRGRALGYTWNPPEFDRVLKSKTAFEDDIAVYLAGRESEILIFGELTTGAQNDLTQATSMARKMVKEYGMSDRLGPISFHDKDEMVFLGRDIAEAKNYSEKTAQTIDDEVQIIMTKAESVANNLVTTHKDILEKIVSVLLEKEVIEREEFEAIIQS